MTIKTFQTLEQAVSVADKWKLQTNKHVSYGARVVWSDIVKFYMVVVHYAYYGFNGKETYLTEDRYTELEKETANG